MIRQPAVAGQFYYADPGMLLEQIGEFTDKNARKEKVLGAVSPHAGYVYSGQVAGKVFSRIQPADTYVILGVNHHGMGAPYALYDEGAWRTPLGDVKVNSGLAAEVLKHSKLLDVDLFAHRAEHSLEVQVPFMQYFSDSFQIVPVALGGFGGDSLEACRDIGEAVAEAVRGTKEYVVVVASTDLTHYEPQESANKKDREALDAVLALDAERLLNVVSSKGISMCGVLPTATMIEACNNLGAEKAELVEYMTSGDTTGDYRQVVGYGGVLVK